MSNFHVALKKVVDDSYDVQIGCGLIDDMIQDIKEGLVGNKKKFSLKPVCHKLHPHSNP